MSEGDDHNVIAFPGTPEPAPSDIPALCAVQADLLYADEHIILTRLTYRSAGQVWLEHLTHDLGDAAG